MNLKNAFSSYLGTRAEQQFGTLLRPVPNSRATGGHMNHDAPSLELLGEHYNTLYGNAFNTYLLMQLVRLRPNEHTIFQLLGALTSTGIVSPGTVEPTSAVMMDIVVLVAGHIRARSEAEATLEVIATAVKSSIVQRYSKVNGVAPIHAVAQPVTPGPIADISQAADNDQPGEEDLEPYIQAVSLAIGWLSMLFEPDLETTLGSLSVWAKSHPGLEEAQLSIEDWLQTPICHLSSGFGSLFPSLILTENTLQQHSSNLFVSTITFSALQDMGRVSIVWSESLGSHLYFDLEKRELFLFSIPSYCVLCLMSVDQMELLQKLLPRRNDISKEMARSFLREVILSYRLLFAQDARSRYLFSHNEMKRLKKKYGRVTDPLLKLLCGEKFGKGIKQLPTEIWPFSCLRYQDNDELGLVEQSTYIDTLDFPALGSRLRSIQIFSQRQDPSLVRDMWRDRRNPMQWLAFWAVLWIGGVTIIIGVAQLIVAIIDAAK